jgi:hypothetical protein
MQLKKDLELKQEGECVGDRAVLVESGLIHFSLSVSG